jgi:hypothetical protein
MGTSASSKGPGAGVSFDPPWLDDIDVPGQDNQNNNVDPAVGVAPKARFGSARRSMGEYVRSGSRDSAKKSLGHYSKTGMGGARNVARRMRASTKTASNFFNTFRSLRDDTNFPLGKEISELKDRGADATEIIDFIVEHVCPRGGSVDEVSCRDSGTSALSEFMDQNTDADFSNLSDDQIWSLTAMYLGNETFNRIQMDIGQAFEKQDVPYVDRVNRLNDMREYIQSEIATQMDALRKTADQKVNMNQLFQDTIKNTFEVFEVEV